jgi:DnaK suppressor protein
MTTGGINQEIINECRKKLILMREDLMNRMRGAKLEITVQEKMSGDEVDQTVAQSLENHFAITQNRIRLQLLEIENALARIQKGQFGICEETQEPIEAERLLALPYTRLSIEGAELREALSRKFVR